jgi:hypothetical protein
MRVWQPRTTALGVLPNISFTVRQLELMGKIIQYLMLFMKSDYINFNVLGTEFMTAACPVTGVLHYMEIQCGKGGMKTAIWKRSDIKCVRLTSNVFIVI